jgi:hypothetical protein
MLSVMFEGGNFGPMISAVEGRDSAPPRIVNLTLHSASNTHYGRPNDERRRVARAYRGLISTTKSAAH